MCKDAETLKSMVCLKNREFIIARTEIVGGTRK
jgi:hypothetical protein